MAVPRREVKLTVEDYEHFPADGNRHELIDGDHFMTPAPSTRHQRICVQLLWHLQSYLRRVPQGEVLVAPVDVVLSEVDVVQPDLIFISASRLEIIGEARVTGPPDLVVEILSPASRKADETFKQKLYDRFGVEEYWMVDPEAESLVIYRRESSELKYVSNQSGKDLITTPLLPGFELPLGEIFP